VLRWVANPVAATEPTEILREHPHAAPFWHGLLHGALRGDDRTAGNTITTVQQAMSLFFQEEIRRRCVPGPGRPPPTSPTSSRQGGTIYLLGREDPYASASPLMTAVAEHVLDTALPCQHLPWGRLCPPCSPASTSCPPPHRCPPCDPDGQRTRPRDLVHLGRPGPAQLAQIFGEHQARALVGLTNTLVVFGGSKDVAFNQEISDLLGRSGSPAWAGRPGRWAAAQVTADDIPILTAAEVRQLKERHALVLSENGAPIIARLHRCIDGKPGQRLLADQARLRDGVGADRRRAVSAEARAAAALVEARRRGLTRDHEDPVVTDRAQPHHGVPPRPLTQRFPHPGRRVEQAYRELDIALYGSDEEKKALGSPRALARPGTPQPASTPTCVPRCGPGSTTSSSGSTTSTSGTWRP
jgi:type IV secretion system protein VirD4